MNTNLFKVLTVSTFLAMPAGGCAVFMAADGTAGGNPSAGRAVGHAVLDVATLGLWEIVGTPAEIAIQKSYPKDAGTTNTDQPVVTEPTATTGTSDEDRAKAYLE